MENMEKQNDSWALFLSLIRTLYELLMKEADFDSFSACCFLYIISWKMNIRKIIGMDNGSSDFRIEVAPKFVTLPKGSKSFILYLEKGMQVLGRFQSDQSISLKDEHYRFRNVFPAQFRVFHLGSSNYTWSLYTIHPQTLQEIFEDSATFNIERTVKLYQMQFGEKEREIQTSFKFRTIDKTTILQLWASAKKEMKTYRSVQKCVFSNQSLQIEFQIEIKNVLDEELEKLQQEGQRMKVRRARSDDYTSNSSGIKLKPNPSELQDRSIDETVEISYTPYKAAFHLTDDEINTKETIQPEISTPFENDKEGLNDRETEAALGSKKESFEDYSATVKIVNPNGQEVIEEEELNTRRLDTENSSNGSSRIPTKKFSLLSDIIELSFQGSSSYGNHDQSSSNGFKHFSLRKDGTFDLINEHQTPPGEPHNQLNKFKTLPDEVHHNLEVKNEFRRALTTEKKLSEAGSSRIQEESALSMSGERKSLEVNSSSSSGDPYGKWILLAALIIILTVITGIWTDSMPKKKLKSKTRVS